MSGSASSGGWREAAGRSRGGGIGERWRLREGGGPLAGVAIPPTMTWGRGGARGTGPTAVGLLLIDSRTIGPVSIDLNAGLTRRSGDGSAAPRTATAWTVASGIPVAGAGGGAVEGVGYSRAHGAGRARARVAGFSRATPSGWGSLAR